MASLLVEPLASMTASRLASKLPSLLASKAAGRRRERCPVAVMVKSVGDEGNRSAAVALLCSPRQGAGQGETR